MHITDLVDVSTLRELNCSLSQALGLEMALTDVDGAPITASERFEVESASADDDIAVVPVYVDGREVAQWHLRDGESGRPEEDVLGRYLMHSQSVGGGPGTACGVIQGSSVGHQRAVALVALVARLITGYASANFGLLERVREHTLAAIEATGTAVALQRMVDRAPVGLVEMDRGGAVLWANRQALALLGIDEYGTQSLAGPSAPWRVESIGDVPYRQSWARVTRRLVRGQTLHDLHCVLSGPGGRRLTVMVDVSPRLSEGGRLARVDCAMREAPGVSRARDLDGGSGVGAALEPLTYAWLELDACRQSPDRNAADVSGRLDILAALLREAVAALAPVPHGDGSDSGAGVGA